MTLTLWYNRVMDNLYRSSDDKVIAGVCGGIAHKFDFNVTGLRWAVTLVTIFCTGIPLVIYAVAWAILKERSTKGMA